MRAKMTMLAVVAALGFAGTASAEPIQKIDDPTPNGQFTGTYACEWEVERDEKGNPKKDANGNPVYKRDANGKRIPTKYCQQKGHVAVYQDGVAACNGNEKITRPDNGSPLQGYIWIGPGRAAKNPTAAAPGNVAGAGNNHEDASGEPTGSSPC
jgi:hypothetical protein